MKTSNLRQLIRESLFELISEGLCAKGKAYAARRKAAGEKHGAYLMGRAVKVCKGQIKGENLNEAEGQVNVFGYQTKHFDVCPGAQSLYKKITDEKLKDDAVESAKLQDALFALEKKALKSGANEEEVKKAQEIANSIMELAQKMGLKAEHQYIQGHVDKIKDAANKVDEVEVKDNTEFNLSLKHLLKKHVTKGGEIDEVDMSINEVLTLEIDENITEAKYKGKTVKLNSPMRGDVKKFKVYVANGKNKDGSIKVKKVNFGHGGTSAKKRGEKTLKIRKSNPKARAAFRARHRCDNPGPKTMARYWSCRKW